MTRLTLFLTGFIQVALVAANTYLIAHGRVISVLIVGTAISLVWTVNVRRVAFGGWWDRVAYSIGAGVGSVVGMCAAKLLS